MHGLRVYNSSGKFHGGKQIFPMTSGESAAASQRLIDAILAGDSKLAFDLLSDPFVDVDFVGTVTLRSLKTELVPNGESTHRVVSEFEEFRTDVTALFLAAHSGNLILLNKLLSFKADINKLFRGYATTAAVRSGHIEILEVLLKARVCQPACEDALLEASYVGRPRHAELLMGSNNISSQVAVHALVTACSRGFLDVIQVLIKCGVDTNAIDRMLLLSSKPYLHLNVDCNAIVAAIVSRQSSVVELLLREGVRTDTKVRLGAWSWDPSTGEECRVGAGLAEPYDIAWCAVEYFEETGSILRLLLQHLSPNTPHLGRTLIYHAILCNNARALDVLLSCGADVEFPLKSSKKTEIRPIHLGARLGEVEILWRLITAGCKINSKTSGGETAVMICTKYKHKECLKALASAGADFGLVDAAGESASSIAGSTRWTLGFQQVILYVIRSGKVVKSSNSAVFSSIIFVVQSNEIQALKFLTKQPDVALDEQDENGFTAAMLAAASGQVETFRLLVYAGADISVSNKRGETALTLSEASCNREAFEQIMLDYALKNESQGPTSSFALHCAARQGDLASVRRLTSMGYDVNAFDGDGYTPLMLAAKEGYGSTCQFLISRGAKCETENDKHETALSLTRKNGIGNEAEHVILDELARVLVLCGTWVKKHTKEGKGSPHWKKLKMIRSTGVLYWGKSGKRNVICRAAEVGPSITFLGNRPKTYSDKQSGLFHVVTTKNQEVHFACDGVEVAKLWVRGIKLVTREAIFGKTTLRAIFNQEFGS
ncbi:ankyrin-3-like [Chenopodium quinoa]|uniref:PH domain-containing protein n=1 Tax=Chenopodium quinoa TaxID=63459 RepID=A0A803M6S2_CHEQI|nr:ankyrin-3-like [Chenopodium quinoa]